MAERINLIGELATREQVGELLFSSLNILPDPDPILRKRGDEAAILADLTADDQVTCAIMARKNRVLNKRDYLFKPGAAQEEKATPAAQAVCDRLTKDLENLKMWDVISGLMDAPFMGFSVLEIIWESAGGWWRIKDLKPKPVKWFAFNADNQLVLRRQGWLEAAPLPSEKFVLTQHFPSYENPYGLRLLSRCLWPVTFKKGGVEFYARFLEKFGIPWPVATAATGATRDEKMAMAADLARMVKDAAAVLPAGATLQLAETSGAAGNQHKVFIDLWNSAISKVLMGQTLTAEVGDKGSYAAAQTHLSVSDEFAEADTHMVVGALNELAWTYSQINAGPAELAPIFAYQEAEDLEAKAALDIKLYSLGVRFKPDYFAQAYGLAPEHFTAPEGQEQPEEPPAFAAAASGLAEAKAQAEEHFAAIETAVKKYAPEALAAEEKWRAQLAEVVEKAESFEDIERGLVALLGATTEPDALEELLGDLMINTAMMGRWAAARSRQ